MKKIRMCKTSFIRDIEPIDAPGRMLLYLILVNITLTHFPVDAHSPLPILKSFNLAIIVKKYLK